MINILIGLDISLYIFFRCGSTMFFENRKKHRSPISGVIQNKSKCAYHINTNNKTHTNGGNSLKRYIV